MNIEDLKNRIFSADFIKTYILIFIILYIFFAFVKFFSSIPVMLFVTFCITYYYTYSKLTPKS